MNDSLGSLLDSPQPLKPLPEFSEPRRRLPLHLKQTPAAKEGEKPALDDSLASLLEPPPPPAPLPQISSGRKPPVCGHLFTEDADAVVTSAAQAEVASSSSFLASPVSVAPVPIFSSSKRLGGGPDARQLLGTAHASHVEVELPQNPFDVTRSSNIGVMANPGFEDSIFAVPLPPNHKQHVMTSLISSGDADAVIVEDDPLRQSLRRQQVVKSNDFTASLTSHPPSPPPSLLGATSSSIASLPTGACVEDSMFAGGEVGDVIMTKSRFSNEQPIRTTDDDDVGLALCLEDLSNSPQPPDDVVTPVPCTPSVAMASSFDTQTVVRPRRLAPQVELPVIDAPTSTSDKNINPTEKSKIQRKLITSDMSVTSSFKRDSSSESSPRKRIRRPVGAHALSQSTPLPGSSASMTSDAHQQQNESVVVSSIRLSRTTLLRRQGKTVIHTRARFLQNKLFSVQYFNFINKTPSFANCSCARLKNSLQTEEQFDQKRFDVERFRSQDECKQFHLQTCSCRQT